jgi:quinoprotein relay system zinc metallohydrolase 2
MRRRVVLARAALAAAAAIAAFSPGAGRAQDFAVAMLAPGVHVHLGAQRGWAVDGAADVANLGLVVGERCAAVVDTGGSIAVGRAWRQAVGRLTDRPVCWVINTHAHPDHVLGNAAFAGAGPDGADPQFVGHARLARAMAARAEHDLRVVARDLAPEHAGTRSVGPGRAVAGDDTLDLGGRTLHLRAWPTAHTDADLTVWDPASGTLWTGDLLFDGHLPVLDGKLLGWLQVLQTLRDIAAQRVVPGHGAVASGWPAPLDPQLRYLRRLRDDVRQALRDGWTLAETVDRLADRDIGPWLLTALFHRRNLTAAYAELEWEQ